MIDYIGGQGGIASQMAEGFASAYDTAAISFLERNKIPVDRKNVAATVRDLREKGLKLISEKEEAGPLQDRKVVYTFYLCKIIDTDKFIMNFHMDLGGNE